MTTPVFSTPVGNPFGLAGVGPHASPTLADIDGDGDWDAVIGASDGNIRVFFNGATASSFKLTLAEVGKTITVVASYTDGFGASESQASAATAVVIASSAFEGTAANDMLLGDIGDNTLNGYAGDDFLDGDAGNDLLTGGNGNDVLSGNAGVDAINGSIGNDVLFGGTGNDTLKADAGDDVLSGGNNSDNRYLGGWFGLDQRGFCGDLIFGAVFPTLVSGNRSLHGACGMRGHRSHKIPYSATLHTGYVLYT